MTNLTRDPKGYYIALGIAEDADAGAIKAAYRQKAKRLHPDFNPSPVAAKQFHRLHEAYDTLSDPEKRAAYDRPWRTAEKAEKKSPPRPEAKAERRAPAQEPPRPAARPRAATADDEPVSCRCGKITAQPRYVVFDLVWGRLKRVHKRTVAGIFCRTCADRAAVKASLITWVAGWWAWPNGPKETVKALANNIRGGRKPADRNARLLLRQARAFRARGETDLARSAGEQALAFAQKAGLRGEVEAFLAPLAGTARTIKDRWAKPGWAPMVQILPLAVVVAAVSTITVYSSPAPLTRIAADLLGRITAPAAPPPAAPAPAGDAAGRFYSVNKDGTAVRTGPGAGYRLEAVLGGGTLVLVTEAAPDGRWLRVVARDGTAGFVAIEDMTASVPAAEDAGAFPAGK